MYTSIGVTFKTQDIIENCVIDLILGLFGDDNFHQAGHESGWRTYIINIVNRLRRDSKSI